jgi:hypothetical protein
MTQVGREMGIEKRILQILIEPWLYHGQHQERL